MNTTKSMRRKKVFLDASGTWSGHPWVWQRTLLRRRGGFH